MRPYIKPPGRDRYQVHTDLINALGGYKTVAALCLVTPVSVSKWMEDPERSGQDIPVKHLLTLLTAAGENLGNLLLQNAVDELLQDHFLNPCLRRAYPEHRVFEFVEMLQGQKPIKVVNE